MLSRLCAMVLTLSLVTPVVACAMDLEEIALRTERMPTDLRLEIFATCYMLTDKEIDDFLAYQSASHFEHWMDKWWHDRDPVYTTTENEARTELRERIALARDRFRADDVPGWDQRGEVVIRYGVPSWRNALPSDVDHSGIRRAGEIWYYRAQDMFVLFEDSFGNGRFTYLIGHVTLPGGARARSDRRSMPSRHLPDTSMDEKAIDAAFHVVLNDGSTFMPDAAGWSEYESFHDRLMRFQETLASHPAMFHGDLAESRLPVDYSIDCFRGGEGVDRVDVNAAFAAGGEDGGRKYVATAVFFNSDGEEAQRNVNTTVVAPVEPAGAPQNLMSQLRFTLPPDFYHVAITVEEFGTGRYASFLADKTCESFDGRLTVSDLVFAARIGPAETESVFNRGSLFVLPHPVRRYPVGQPVPLYFEVYNLSPGRDGQASYTVAYRLRSNTARPQGFLALFRDATPLDVESRFTSTCPGRDDVVHITLRTGNLWKGSYTLEVTITDEVSERQVGRAVDFEISE